MGAAGMEGAKVAAIKVVDSVEVVGMAGAAEKGSRT